jgi:hypothetical protein
LIDGRHPTVFEECGGVVEGLAERGGVPVDEPDQGRGLSAGAGHPLEGKEIVVDEAGRLDQVPRGIPGQGQLREDDQAATGPAGPLEKGQDAVGIAPDVPNGRVDLGEANLHPLLRPLVGSRAAST